MCNNCSICLEQFDERDTIRTNCNHRFHKECFYALTMVNKHVKCPLCRSKFDEEWFLNLKEDLRILDVSDNKQQFEDSWTWWEDFFAECRRRNERENELIFEFHEPDENEDWVEFLRMPDENEINHGYNQGRIRIDVNPEMVVWEGEIEDLFEEAERMQQNSNLYNDDENEEELEVEENSATVNRQH